MRLLGLLGDGFLPLAFEHLCYLYLIDLRYRSFALKKELAVYIETRLSSLCVPFPNLDMLIFIIADLFDRENGMPKIKIPQNTQRYLAEICSSEKSFLTDMKGVQRPHY